MENNITHNYFPISNPVFFIRTADDGVNSLYAFITSIAIVLPVPSLPFKNNLNGNQRAVITFVLYQGYSITPEDISTVKFASGSVGQICTFEHDGSITDFKMNNDGSVECGINISQTGVALVNIMQSLRNSCINTIKQTNLWKETDESEMLTNIHVENRMKEIYESQ